MNYDQLEANLQKVRDILRETDDGGNERIAELLLDIEISVRKAMHAIKYRNLVK